MARNFGLKRRSAAGNRKREAVTGPANHDYEIRQWVTTFYLAVVVLLLSSAIAIILAVRYL